jgi:hypothetical protein
MTSDQALGGIFDLLNLDSPEMRKDAEAAINLSLEMYGGEKNASAKDREEHNKKLYEIGRTAARLAELLEGAGLLGNDVLSIALLQDPAFFRAGLQSLARWLNVSPKARRGRKSTARPLGILVSSLKGLYRRHTKKRIAFSRRADGTPYGTFFDFVRAILDYGGIDNITDAQIEHAIRFAKTHTFHHIRTRLAINRLQGLEIPQLP